MRRPTIDATLRPSMTMPDCSNKLHTFYYSQASRNQSLIELKIASTDLHSHGDVAVEMHFWIDKRSPYGFGRGARVSGSGFGQYPRRLRPSKPWNSNRNTATTPTSSDRNTYPAHSDVHHYHHPNPNHHQHPAGGGDSTEDTSSPSYCKWSLWAFAIALSSLLFYIVLFKLYHDHQMFTFCALLAVVFILGVCTVSTLFRRTANADPIVAGPASTSPDAAPSLMLRQESSTSSSGRTTCGGGGVSGSGAGHPVNNANSNNNSHTLSSVVPDNRSPSISIHNLAESPTPYHNSHNQV